MVAIIIFLLSFHEEDEYIPFHHEIKAYLDSLEEHPLDINSASFEELVKIPYIPEPVARKIIKHRPYSHKKDLLLYIDPLLYKKIKKYITIRKTSEPRKKIGYSRIGAKGNNLLFDSLAFYGKTTINFKNFNFLGLIEKDKGETEFTDFTSFGLYYRNDFLKASLGSYELHYGQGLVCSRPYTYSVSKRYLFSGRGEGPGLQTSFSENTSYFGGAVQVNLKTFEFGGFISNQRLDAYLTQDGKVKSLYRSGIHDDSASIAAKDKLGEKLGGGRVEWKKENVAIGITGYKNFYSPEFAPEDSIHSFYGNSLLVVGTDWGLVYKDYFFYGEVAKSFPGKGAILIGMKYMDKKFCSSLRFVYQQARFFSPHGRYYGLAKRREKISAAYSLNYKFLDTKIYFYGSGYQTLLTGTTLFYTTMGAERKEEWGIVEMGVKRYFSYEEDKSYQIFYKHELELTKSLSFRLRIQEKRRVDSPDKGWKGELQSLLKFDKFKLVASFAYFYTEPDINFYSYEYIVPGCVFSIPFEEEGIKLSLGSKISWSKLKLAGIGGVILGKSLLPYFTKMVEIGI